MCLSSQRFWIFRTRRSVTNTSPDFHASGPCPLSEILPWSAFPSFLSFIVRKKKKQKQKKAVSGTKWAGQRTEVFLVEPFSPQGLSASLHTCAWEAQQWSCDIYTRTRGKDAQHRRAVSRGTAWGSGRAWQESSGFLWSQTTLRIQWKPLSLPTGNLTFAHPKGNQD